jgi:hypothetical protein
VLKVKFFSFFDFFVFKVKIYLFILYKDKGKFNNYKKYKIHSTYS